MVLKETSADIYKKERMIWLLISVIGSIVFIVLMTNAYAFTQYISTKEIVSILVGKVRKVGEFFGNGDSNKD